MLVKGAELKLLQFDYEDAIQEYQTAKKVAEKIAEDFSHLRTDAENEIQAHDSMITHCHAALGAMESPLSLTDSADAELICTHIRLLTNYVTLREGEKDKLSEQLTSQERIAEAIRLLDILSAFTDDSQNFAYSAACAESLVYGALSRNESEERDKELRDQLEQRQSNALNWIQKTLERGYQNQYQLITDPDLESIRQLQKFQEFINSLNEAR